MNIEHIKVDTINEEINLNELQLFNKIKYDDLELKLGELTKKVIINH